MRSRPGWSLQPVVTDPDGIRHLLEAADADPACLGVIAWMHTFSPAKMWIAGLRSLRKPLVHLHTQFEAETCRGRPSTWTS